MESLFHREQPFRSTKHLEMFRLRPVSNQPTLSRMAKQTGELAEESVKSQQQSSVLPFTQDCPFLNDTHIRTGYIIMKKEHLSGWTPRSLPPHGISNSSTILRVTSSFNHQSM